MNGLVLSNPVILLLELTNKCNHNCFGCGNVFEKEKHKYIDVDFLEEFIPNVKKSIFDIRLTGGEPTLHPQFEDIVNLIDKNNISFSVLSNGNWKSTKPIQRLLSGKKNFKGFLISLHGHTDKIHDNFVNCKNSFENVIANIKQLTKDGFYVSTNTIINNDTVSYIDEIAELSHSLGATYSVFNRYYGAHSDFRVDDVELKFAVEKVTKMRKSGQRIRLGNCTPLCFADCDSDGCPGGNFVATIDPWLNLRPCNHASITGGNVGRDKLEKVWHSPQMMEWRNLIPDSCNNCIQINNCGGGCRAEGLFYGTKKDPLVGNNITTYIPDKNYILNLYKNQRFNIHYRIRNEDFGYLLFFEGEVVLVNEESKPLLDDLSLKSTVFQISQKYGDTGMEIISELLLRGFISYN